MEKSVYRFGLELPAQRDPQGTAPDLRRKAMDRWLAGLPLAEPVRAAGLLYDRLMAANRLPLGPAERLRLLEQVQAPAASLADAIEAGVIGRGLPLTPKGLRLADQALELLSELATGYKIVVADVLSARSRRERRLLAGAIHRATLQLGRILLSGYKTYSPPPRGAWRQLHRLYHLATRARLSRLRVREPAPGLPTTIDDVYKHALVLALSDPYRLRRAEAEVAYGALARWAPRVGLSSAPPAGRRSGLFQCRLDMDAPPALCAASTEAGEAYRILVDLAEPAARLRRVIAQGTGPGSPALGHDLSRRLLRSWEQRNSRAFPRAPKCMMVRIALGLSTAHALIARAENPSGPPRGPMGPLLTKLMPTEFPGTELSLVPEHEYTEHWWRGRPEDLPSVWSGYPQQPSPPQPAGPRTARAIPHTSKTLDVSAGGYCFLWAEGTPLPAQVGELIAVREAERPGSWSVGVVRWMQYIKGEGLRLGVQTLAPGAVAVCSQGRQPRAPDQETVNCLQLPGTHALQQPPTLLTPANRFAVGDTLMLEECGEARRVKLTKQLENTGDFARFQFIAQQGAEAAARESRGLH